LGCSVFARQNRKVRTAGSTGRERYAVVSCHVERPLDDRAWALFAELQERRPGGFRVAALIRPADPSHDEDEAAWVVRAREAAERGPLGHHTHWTAPDHARPSGDGDPAARVLSEGRRLKELGLRPTLFCGGGWYSDAGVASACAELGYADCTATSYRPAYLPSDAPRLALAAPARLTLDPGTSLLELPSTHSLGMAARAVVTPSGPGADVVHLHFHDTDLADARRRAGLVWTLRVLARRRSVTDLDLLAAELRDTAPETAFEQVAVA
jgi:hypothetical protein